MKKILINSRFLTRPITGVERYAQEIIKMLCVIGGSTYNFVQALPKGEKVNTCSNMELFQDSCDLNGHLWEQIRLPMIMKKTGADLLWSPCNSGPLLVKKHVVTIHDAAVYSNAGWFKKSYGTFYRTLLPLLAHQSMQVITDSEFSKSELINYGVCKSDKISVVHAGVNADSFNMSKENTLNAYGKYILTVGSRDPRKNISTLIKAWNSILPDKKIGVKLIIAGGVGPGFVGENIKSDSHDILFLGYVDDEKLPVLYSNAEVFIYPSYYEGFGMPPLEAMLCGTPVIVSNVSSMPEICEEAALYCNPYDPTDVAEKIITLLSDSKLRTDLINRGSEQIKKFTWRKSAERLLQIFDESICSKS